MNITFKQMLVFSAVANSQSLTLAAEKLYLSKAAVSMALSELEKQLGKALFDRINNRLVLNSEGAELLPFVQELIDRSRAIESFFNTSDTLYGDLKIAASNTIGNQILPEVIGSFRQKTGHLKQSLYISNSQNVCNKISHFDADIAFIEGDVEDNALDKQEWMKDSMCIIASVNSPFLDKKTLFIKDLVNTAWVLREPGSGSREYFTKALAPQLANWTESFQLRTTEAIINSVSAGLGLACISEHSVKQAIKAGAVSRLAINLPIKRQFWLVTHKNKYQNPLLKAFIQHCQNLE